MLRDFPPSEKPGRRVRIITRSAVATKSAIRYPLSVIACAVIIIICFTTICGFVLRVRLVIVFRSGCAIYLLVVRLQTLGQRGAVKRPT